MEYGHQYEQLPVEPGFEAPDFTLEDQNGRNVNLRDFLDNRNLVLVFIRPENDARTGAQLDYLRDSYERILYHCGSVLVISPGGAGFNRGLAEKHRLPFSILSDEDCTVLKRYQVYNPYEKLVGPNVFIINCAGLITYMYNGKNPEDIVAMADIIAVLHDLAESGGAQVFGGVANRNI